MLILYIPLIVIFTMFGFQAQRVIDFEPIRIYTLDVIRYFTLDTTAEGVIFPDKTVELLESSDSPFPEDTGTTIYAPSLATAIFLILLAMLFCIRRSITTASRSPCSEHIQVFFGPSISTSNSILKAVPFAPVDVGAVTEESADDGYEIFHDSIDSTNEGNSLRGEDLRNTARQQLLDNLVSGGANVLEMVLWHPYRSSPSVDHEEVKGQHNERLAFEPVTVECTQDSLDQKPNESLRLASSPRFPLLLGFGNSGATSIETMPFTSTPPRTPQPTECACPSWPPEAPSPSKLPRLYPSLSTASDLQAENESPVTTVRQAKQELPLPQPPPTSKAPTSPQNWRARRSRPTITEGGFRMLRHFLGVTRKTAPKNNIPNPDNSLQHIKPEGARSGAAKDDSLDETLVDQPGAIGAVGTTERHVCSEEKGSTKSGKENGSS